MLEKKQNCCNRRMIDRGAKIGFVLKAVECWTTEQRGFERMVKIKIIALYSLRNDSTQEAIKMAQICSSICLSCCCCYLFISFLLQRKLLLCAFSRHIEIFVGHVNLCHH